MRYQVPHNRIKLFLASVFRKRIGHIHGLEQLECLRLEDTHRRLMITHTVESYWIPSQKKSKSLWQICQNCTFLYFETIFTHHPLFSIAW